MGASRFVRATPASLVWYRSRLDDCGETRPGWRTRARSRQEAASWRSARRSASGPVQMHRDETWENATPQYSHCPNRDDRHAALDGYGSTDGICCMQLGECKSALETKPHRGVSGRWHAARARPARRIDARLRWSQVTLRASSPRGLLPERQTAALLDRGLFYSFELTLEACQLGSSLAIAIDHERRGPEQHDRYTSSHGIIRSLVILYASKLRNSGRNSASFRRDLLAAVSLVLQR